MARSAFEIQQDILKLKQEYHLAADREGHYHYLCCDQKVSRNQPLKGEGTCDIIRTDRGFDVVCSGCSFDKPVPTGAEARRLASQHSCSRYARRLAREAA